MLQRSGRPTVRARDLEVGVAVLLALASAAVYGASDFLGGLSSPTRPTRN